MNRIWQWVKDKAGRIVSSLGALLAGADLDISPVKDSLEGLLSHKGVQFITVALFLGSWLRHQWVANQHQDPDPLPPPAPESAR